MRNVRSAGIFVGRKEGLAWNERKKGLGAEKRVLLRAICESLRGGGVGVTVAIFAGWREVVQKLNGLVGFAMRKRWHI